MARATQSNHDLDGVLRWLEAHRKSTNIVQLSQALNTLNIFAITLGNQVSGAYEILNELEHEYDSLTTNEFLSLIEAKKNSAAAAKPLSEQKYVDLKLSCVKARNIYKRLSVQLDRVDRLSDVFRQYISNLKDERSYSQGQV
jgi:hypothetical protein